MATIITKFLSMVRISFLSIFVIQTIFFVFSGCVKKEEVAKKKREFSLPVQIGKIIVKDVTDQVRTVGNIRAEQRVTINAEVEGQITQVKVGEGDEVITTVNTFVATAGAIETAGAKIVFVDCNEKYVMDTSKVEAAITPNTKVILPVHFAGQPVDMPCIMEIKEKHNLDVVEDACQAIGAKINGKFCGTYGVLAGYSLHPLKNLNVWGDAGVIITDYDEMLEKLRLMRNHGMINRNEYAFYAYNSRLDTLQAVVGNHLIKDKDWITEARIDHAKRYDEAFKGLSDYITIPPRSENEECVYHLYMLLVKNRDELNAYLKDKGIE